jgi:hypothetical protein
LISTTRFLKTAAAVATVAMAAGCATQAPNYSASIDNVQKLQDSVKQPIKVGAFAAKPGAVGATSIQLRAVSMASPVGGGYAAYLSEALKQELELAKLLNASSNVEITGTLLGTDIDTAMGTASGYAEAQFVVTKDGKVRFDKVKRGQSSWESSFAGPVAIPKAQQSYPVIVQQLLGALFADPDFTSALK